MNRVGNELNKLVNRSLDRHVRLAVTGVVTRGQNRFYYLAC